jgi:hypothetical protein
LKGELQDFVFLDKDIYTSLEAHNSEIKQILEKWKRL